MLLNYNCDMYQRNREKSINILRCILCYRTSAVKDVITTFNECHKVYVLIVLR
jgi:hypothetical protein